MSITVQRCGVTASNFRIENADAELRWGRTPEAGTGSVKVSFHMKSAGGGTTDVLVSIPPEHFAELAELMAIACPSAAARAFAKATPEGGFI